MICNTILLREIENALAFKMNDASPMKTPSKSIANRLIGGSAFLRNRRGCSGSRSQSSLHVNATVPLAQSSSKANEKQLNLTTHNSSSRKSRSVSRHVHQIPTAPAVIEPLRRNRSKSVNSRQGSGTGTKSVSPSISKKESTHNTRGSNYGSRKDSKHHHQQFSVNPQLYDEYELGKGVDIAVCESRDTPQFQQESLYHLANSSLYVRTSAASSIQAHRRANAYKNGIISNYTSLGGQQAQSDMYCETSEKKSTLSKKQQMSGRKRIKNHIQEQLSRMEDENQENTPINALPRIELVQASIDKSNGAPEVKRLKEQIEQIELKYQRLQIQSQRRVDEYKGQIEEKDKIIESLEYQNEARQIQIDTLQDQIKTLQQDDSKGLVLNQIQQMKSVIEDFKEREHEKERLLLKLKSKDDTIRRLEKDLDSLKVGTTDNELRLEIEVKRLKDENKTLSGLQADKIERMEEKFQKLYIDYKLF